MYNDITIIKTLTDFVMKYPRMLFQLIIEDSNTEQYAKIAFYILIIFFIMLMFFGLFCCVLLLIKACWVILKGICFWFFGRDTLKEYLIKEKEEEREFLREMFVKLVNEIKGLNK